MTLDNHLMNIFIENIDYILRHKYVGYFIVGYKILDKKNRIAEITIHTHESTKQDKDTIMCYIKKYMEDNYNATIISNKYIKKDEILDDTYEIKILTMNRYLGGE